MIDARPRPGDGLDRDASLVVGVDVGGSKVAVLVVDRDLRPLGRTVGPFASGAPDLAAAVIADAVGVALIDAGADLHDVAAVGVGVPGRVDPIAGTVTLAVNLGWTDVPLGPRLGAALGRPIALENDVRAATIGLHRRRVAGTTDDLAYVAIGTGVSAGVVLGGRLHRGVRGLAGEIGHVIVDADGPACPCGQLGCLEALVAGPAIARRAAAAVRGGRSSALAAAEPLTAVEVYRAAAAGDALALELTTDGGRRLAWAVHLLVMTYDVRRVVIGGGVSHAGVPFEAPIRAELDRLRESSPLAAEQLVADVLEVLPAGSEAGAWGAATIAGLAIEAAGPDRREVGHATKR